MLKKLTGLLLVTAMMLSSVTGIFAKEASAASAIDMVDFVVEVEEGRKPRVLQLSDTQIIDSSQMSTSNRLSAGEVTKYAPDKKDENCYNYVRDAVEEYNPDLIIITGDLIYGRFDDSGESLIDMIEFFDSLQIPWAPVFGNHDVESKKGADWQCQQLEESEYCLFEQRELTGNGNYTVGIVQGGELKRVFFMLDSNTTAAASDESMANGHTRKDRGFGQDQIDWYEDLMADIKAESPDTKLSAAFHVQLAVMGDAIAQYGSKPINLYEVGQNGDYGYINENLKYPWDEDKTVYNGMKRLGVDSIFNGHVHTNNGSVLYEGIRFVYGLKSGTYDYHNEITADGKVVKDDGIAPYVGGTAIDINEDGSINNVYHVLSSETKKYVPQSNRVLFEESFEEDFASKIDYGMEPGRYGAKVGKWSTSSGSTLAWSNDGGEGRIYAEKANEGGMQFVFDEGEEYTEEIPLKITADVLAGSTSSDDYARVDIIGLNDTNDVGKISLCSFSGGKIYANCLNSSEDRDTGATYTEGKRYIVKAFIYEAEEVFKLSVYDKETGSVVLENYNVTPYKHDKSNWYAITNGFKGINFYSKHTSNENVAYSLYDIKVEKSSNVFTVEQEDITLFCGNEIVENWNDVGKNLSTVVVDFGVPMNRASLTEENVYIEDTNTAEKISYEATYANNVYTLNLKEDLEEGSIYKIIITKNVETADGGKNSVDTALRIKTTLPDIIGNTLFEETFEEEYQDKTKYNGRKGTWTIPDGFYRNGSGDDSRIYLTKGNSATAEFNLTIPYEEKMVLNVRADILTGVVDENNGMRIDIVGLNETYGSGRVSLCYLTNGKIYANCMGEETARYTGATYEKDKRYIIEGVIDEANKTFTLSVYDKATGNAILKDYNVTPYKHTKSNWYELTNGFSGVYFYGKRASNANYAYCLEDISVKLETEDEEEKPEQEEFNTTLFEETFEAGYETKTSYSGKTGAWKVSQGDGCDFWQKESQIYPNKGKNGNADFALVEPYEEQMVLKLSADISAGVINTDNAMQIDVVGWSEGHSASDDGRITLCYLENGKIYANCIGATDSRDTGATYTAGQRMIVEGIIDQANKTFTLSVYDKATGNAILKDYNVTPYKHTKSNYYELTHGFTGIRFRGKRASTNANSAYTLYDISVKTLGEEKPEPDMFNVSLFEETFEADYAGTTSYSGKTGEWKVPADKFYQSGSGEASEIHVLKGQTSNVDFAFNEPYSEKMVLKVTADIVTGVADSNNSMRIDVVGLNEVYTANDDGRLSLCYLENGKIYANCMGATQARNTGATYTEKQKLKVEGIIDQANKTFTLSVYDKETGKAILKNYNVTPYKHDKLNYYELTHGFTGVRFQAKRASDANQAFELYDLSVMTQGEAVAEGTFAEITDVSVNGTAVNDLSQLSTGDKINVTVDYTNSTGEAKTLYLIVACHDDENGLTSLSYVTKDVDGSVRADEIEFESKQINIAGADRINIMVWDGLNSLKPLSKLKTLR